MASVLRCFRGRTAGMQLKEFMGTRESCQVQAMTCKVRQANKARET
jgi:hypothetical protein